MRFLVDAQLPPALARWLTQRGHPASHVADHGMTTAGDKQIWRMAAELGTAIVTKDEDFVHLRGIDPAGPVVVWVRLGNTTRRALLDAFAGVWPHLEHALSAGERLVEVRGDSAQA
jgi:predicted nuclease of predicted toxin-antitoxin system